MKTAIDWLKFRTKTGPFETFEALRPMFGSLGYLLQAKTGAKPMDGWKFALEISLAGDIALGRIDYGGESQREWVRVNITGEGCGFVESWEEAERLGDVLEESEITRLDIQLTTRHGEITDQRIADAHAAGLFTAGGRPPEMRSIMSSDPSAGKTRYIGNRKYDKFCRCYEKGFEMIQRVKGLLPHSEDLGKCGVQYEGEMCQVNELYRVEVEFKNKTKFIPWMAIGRRDHVFAGAYPFCAALLPDVPHMALHTIPDFKAKTELERALEYLRVSYGPTLRAAVMAHGGDESKVMKRIMSETPSRALIEAGVLTVDHE
jgi:DNA relaxase NicK